MVAQLIISRNEAIEKGLSRYMTGKPCVHGHNGFRYVNGRVCVECVRRRDKLNPRAYEQKKTGIKKYRDANFDILAKKREDIYLTTLKKSSNNGKIWSTAEDFDLRMLRYLGLSYHQIAVIIGRTINSASLRCRLINKGEK